MEDSGRTIRVLLHISGRDPVGSAERVVERSHEKLQLFEGAAVSTDLLRLVLHYVAQVLQLLAARSALLVSAATEQASGAFVLSTTQSHVKEETSPGPDAVRRPVTTLRERGSTWETDECLLLTAPLGGCRLQQAAPPSACPRSTSRNAS